MLTLTANQIAAKNALAGAGSWLELAELYLPGSTTASLRLANNTEALFYPGQNLVSWSNDLTHWTASGSPTVSYGHASWDGTLTASKIVSSGNQYFSLSAAALSAGLRYRISLRMKLPSGIVDGSLIVRNSGINQYYVTWAYSADTQDANGWRLLMGEFTPSADLSAVTFLVMVAGLVEIESYVADIQICRAIPCPFVLTAGTAAAGSLYTACPFRRDEIEETSKGNQPRIKLQLGNVDDVVRDYMTANPVMNGAKVRLLLVHSGFLNEAPVQDLWWEIMDANCDAAWATFELGADNLSRRRFPQGRILKNHCRWQFKSAGCGYSGAATSCSKTLSACRTLSNSARFGGFPGVGSGGIYA